MGTKLQNICMKKFPLNYILRKQFYFCWTLFYCLLRVLYGSCVGIMCVICRYTSNKKMAQGLLQLVIVVSSVVIFISSSVAGQCLCAVCLTGMRSVPFQNWNWPSVPFLNWNWFRNWNWLLKVSWKWNWFFFKVALELIFGTDTRFEQLMNGSLQWQSAELSRDDPKNLSGVEWTITIFYIINHI